MRLNRRRTVPQFSNYSVDAVLNTIHQWTFQGKRFNVLNTSYAMSVTEDKGHALESNAALTLVELG
jgi:hypothetical protein